MPIDNAEVSGGAMMQHFDLGELFRAEVSRNRTFTEPLLIPTFRVGQPLRPRRRSWREGSQLSQSRGGYELTIIRRDVDDDMVDAVSRGPAEFALIVEQPVIVLAFRFGDSIEWNDVPYSWHMQPPEWRVVPPLRVPIGARALLWVTLVSSDDGIIRAQRGLTLSPDFSCGVNDAIRAQATTFFDPDECTSAISRLYLGYASPESRLSLAKSRTMGNE